MQQIEALELSVIIVSYNVKYFLEICLASVSEAGKNITSEIIVVDNKSSDRSLDYLVGKFPGVQFISNDENLGFGKACNLGLSKAKGRYVLFLNPDTIVPEDAFSECIRFADSQTEFGALGCRMIDGNGYFLPESKRLFPTVTRSIFRLSGLGKIFHRNKVFAGYYAGHLPEHKTNEIDVLAGAFLLSKNSTLQTLNGFDEDFFMYGEDIDLSFRIQKLGLKNYYHPAVSIIHFKGESIQKFSKEHRNSFYGAMKLFVNKHYKKGIATSVLKAGISLSSLLAAPKNKSNIKSQSTAAIAASDTVFQKLVHILKYAESPLTLAGRVSLAKESNALCEVEDLSACIRKEKFDTLVIACRDTSFKRAIQITSAHKGKIQFLYNCMGSEAIVGSNDKNSQGTVIVRTL